MTKLEKMILVLVVFIVIELVLLAALIADSVLADSCLTCGNWDAPAVNAIRTSYPGPEEPIYSGGCSGPVTWENGVPTICLPPATQTPDKYPGMVETPDWQSTPDGWIMPTYVPPTYVPPAYP